MNALDKVTLNSVNMIDDRLRLLQEELKEIEKQFGPLKTEKPVEKPTVAGQRYQELPKIDPEPSKPLTLKPQIKEEYLRTLQYVPDIMAEYRTISQEPQFTNEIFSLPIPPRITTDNSLLSGYLDKRNKKIR